MNKFLLGRGEFDSRGKKLTELEAQVTELSVRASATARLYAKLAYEQEKRFAALEINLAAEREKVANRSRIIGRLREKVANRNRLIGRLNRRVRDLEGSKSWRMTAPLRGLEGLFTWTFPKKLRGSATKELSAPPRAQETKNAEAKSAEPKEKTPRPIKPTPKMDAGVRKLQHQLWGGFSRYAIEKLESLKLSPSASRRKVSGAAWALARWFAAEHDFERAYENIIVMRLVDPSKMRTDSRPVLLAADCLTRLGDRDIARNTLSFAAKWHPDESDLYLAMANTYAPLGVGEAENDEIRLSWINRVFERANLVPIAKADPALPLSIDNLTTAANPVGSLVDQPKVSVIIPTYNSADFISTSINSLLCQTWHNIEIIVVDDFSTDGTRNLLEEIVERDDRIKLQFLDTNGGPYIARNVGLRMATGEYVTCQDADDWSHPMRLELQVKNLIDESRFIANVSNWARATPSLFFEIKPHNRIIHFNTSSIMFRREPVLNTLGYWDSVRFAGDTEFWHRLRTGFGEDATAKLPQMLALARTHAGSITQEAYTNTGAKKLGARRAHQHAYSHWHQRANNLYMPFPLEKRLFGVPRRMLSTGATESHYDVVLISDFRHLGGSTYSNVQELIAQSRAGIRTAIVHVDRYDFLADRIHPSIQNLIDEGAVDILVYGDKVSAALAIIRFPAIFGELQSCLPEVSATHVKVVVNQSPRRVIGEAPFYSVDKCLQHIEEYLGNAGDWVPIGPAVRRAFEADGIGHLLTREYWFNIIDVDEWKVTRSAWLDTVPVIGRHGRDKFEKWPTDPRAIVAAYPTDGSMRVRILGGASIPSKILGAVPTSWEIMSFDQIDPKEFLGSIEFFVFFPHEGRIEAFGRTIIEAMASGCLVVLPEMFKEIFGNAAVYCEPASVNSTVWTYYSDREAYERQVGIAEAFVRANFSFEKHIQRVRHLIHQN